MKDLREKVEAAWTDYQRYLVAANLDVRYQDSYKAVFLAGFTAAVQLSKLHGPDALIGPVGEVVKKLKEEAG